MSPENLKRETLLTPLCHDLAGFIMRETSRCANVRLKTSDPEPKRSVFGDFVFSFLCPFFFTTSLQKSKVVRILVTAMESFRSVFWPSLRIIPVLLTCRLQSREMTGFLLATVDEIPVSRMISGFLVDVDRNFGPMRSI